MFDIFIKKIKNVICRILIGYFKSYVDPSMTYILKIFGLCIDYGLYVDWPAV